MLGSQEIMFCDESPLCSILTSQHFTKINYVGAFYGLNLLSSQGYKLYFQLAHKNGPAV